MGRDYSGTPPYGPLVITPPPPPFSFCRLAKRPYIFPVKKLLVNTVTR